MQWNEVINCFNKCSIVIIDCVYTFLHFIFWSEMKNDFTLVRISEKLKIYSTNYRSEHDAVIKNHTGHMKKGNEEKESVV